MLQLWKKSQLTGTFRRGEGGRAFIKAGLCEVTVGMQEVDLMWCFVNLYNKTVSV